MKNYILKSGLLILLLLKSTTALAVWYQVEMIVFENLYPDPDGENWYQQPELVPLNNTVDLLISLQGQESIDDQEPAESTEEPELIAYGILPEDNNRLEGVYRVLRLSREFRPLYHVSWQQPGLEQNRARPVHIQAEDSENLFELTIPPLLTRESTPAEFYEPIKLLFDGSIQIRSSLYLHVDLDMVLFQAPPVDETESEVSINKELDQASEKLTEPVEYVRLTESRRIILNELHYFDHPLFGVILQVSRFGP